MNRGELIHDLSKDLEPVRQRPAVQLLAVTWLLLGFAYVVLTTHLLGPLRPGVMEQLQHHPRFLVETLAGLVVIGLVTTVSFLSSVPAALSRKLVRVTVLAIGLWIMNFSYGLLDPALTPSMDGKRHHCYIETLLYSLPPMLLAIYLQQKQFPLKPHLSAIWAGLAAGLIPAWYMQVACMYEPTHILLFHILPGLLMGLLGGALWWMWSHLRS